MHDSDHCVGCGRAVALPDQKFCPACGQPTPVHRIDWHFLGHELEHSVLHMDRGVFYTLKNLMRRPGHFIRDYIDGRRAGHVRPLFLIMVMAAAVVFLARFMLHGDIVGSAVDSGFSEGVQAGSGGKSDGAAVAALFVKAKDWVNGHYALTTLLLLPLEAAALKLAFRRVRALNYPEWLVITAFITAQGFLIHALLVPLDPWLPGRQQWTAALLFGYAIFTLVQFFDGYPRWKSVLRTVLGFLLYEVAVLLVMAIAVVAIIVAGKVHA